MHPALLHITDAHHAYFKVNYALYMPIWDMVFGTYDAVRTRRDFDAAIVGRERAADKRQRQRHQGKKESQRHEGEDEEEDSRRQQVIPRTSSPLSVIGDIICGNAKNVNKKPPAAPITIHHHHTRTRSATQEWRLETDVDYCFFVHPIDSVDFLRFTAWSRTHMKQSGPDLDLSFLEAYFIVPVVSLVFPILVLISPWLGAWLVDWTYALVDNRTLGGMVRPLPVLPAHYLHPLTSGATLEALKASMTQVKAAHPEIAVCGLGALNKNVIFSKSGKKLVEHADELGVKLATGNTMTAAVACRYLQRAAAAITGGSRCHSHRRRRVYVTGATSSCGQGIVEYLALNGFDVTFYTRSASRGAALLGHVEAELAGVWGEEEEEVDEQKGGERQRVQGSVSWSSEIADASDFDFVLLGSSSSAVVKHLARARYVGNFAVPPPKGLEEIEYEDVGKLAFSSDREVAGKLAFSMEGTIRCLEGTTFACHVGTKVHAHAMIAKHEVGTVDACDMDFVMSKAIELGFRLVGDL